MEPCYVRIFRARRLGLSYIVITHYAPLVRFNGVGEWDISARKILSDSALQISALASFNLVSPKLRIVSNLSEEKLVSKPVISHIMPLGDTAEDEY